MERHAEPIRSLVETARLNMNPDQLHKRLQEGLGIEIEWSEGPVDPFYLIPSDFWVKAGLFVRDATDLSFEFLRSLCGVDYPDEKSILVVAHLFSYQHKMPLVLKTKIDRDQPKIESLASVWPAACWHERETYDLLGVVFTGNPDLRRILLPEDWVGHPLRKDYQPPNQYHGIPTTRPVVDCDGEQL